MIQNGRHLSHGIVRPDRHGLGSVCCFQGFCFVYPPGNCPPTIAGTSRFVDDFPNFPRLVGYVIFSSLESKTSLRHDMSCTTAHYIQSIVPESRPGPKRKQSYSNHPFSGAEMLVSGKVSVCGKCHHQTGNVPYRL